MAQMSNDLIQKIIDWEQGLLQEEQEVIDFFQELVDTGMAWRLQGAYGRVAAALIDQGLVSDRPILH
jgi:hypothetical protein